MKNCYFFSGFCMHAFTLPLKTVLRYNSLYYDVFGHFLEINKKK